MRWVFIVVVALVIGFAYWVEPDTVRIVEDGSTLQMIGRVKRSEFAPPSTCMVALPIGGGSQGVAVYTPCSMPSSTSTVVAVSQPSVYTTSIRQSPTGGLYRITEPTTSLQPSEEK